MVTANCPECSTEIRIPHARRAERAVTYYCAVCEKPVRVQLRDEEDVPGAGQGVRRRKVLVAEDEGLLSRTAAALLRRQGYDVLVAGDGESSLEVIHREHPDLVLLDLALPGMTGFAVLRALQSESGPRPIVLVTSAQARRPEEILKAHALGADGFIPAELLRDTLLFRVESLLL